MWYNMAGSLTMKKRTRCSISGIGLLAMTLTLFACAQNPTPQASLSEVGAVTPLPTPLLAGQMSLEETLARRRSVREFDDRPLTTEQLSQLLWAAQGITNQRGYRTAPSAGALYPLEVYVATQEGVFHYDPDSHHLIVHSGDDARASLFEAALRQEPIRQAPAVFVLTAVYERTATKYGEQRSPRYVHLETGHAAQNLLLKAVALQLGAVAIGAFYDEQVQQALGIPLDHEPLYLIPVGHPRDSGQ
jgi:SagB-type dehydrogenase family enzyme